MQPAPGLSGSNGGSRLVLALESSADVVWVGGPNPWLTAPEKHFHKVSLGEGDDESVVKIDAKKNWNAMYVYRATCLKLGSVSATLAVGNLASKDLPMPAVSTSTVEIVCAQPDRVKLTTQHQVPPRIILLVL